MNGGRPGRRPYNVADSIFMGRASRNLTGERHSQFQRCMITSRLVQIPPLITMLILAFGDVRSISFMAYEYPEAATMGRVKMR